MSNLTGDRLTLIPLSQKQLRAYLENLPALETELGIPLSSQIVDANVTRAINAKLARMAAVSAEEHLWYTYWLIVVNEMPFGAGLAGFKGVPNNQGSVEIGYGIDPQVQGKGYITEAVELLVKWALSQPECQRVTATAVINPASSRVLQKLGFTLVNREGDQETWHKEKQNP